ncbi:MAG: hypothetical protein IIB17_03650 [Chloroflexi bacterium]|nr:hypothetical protein [Chloroflexota bacterium]
MALAPASAGTPPSQVSGGSDTFTASSLPTSAALCVVRPVNPRPFPDNHSSTDSS